MPSKMGANPSGTPRFKAGCPASTWQPRIPRDLFSLIYCLSPLGWE